MSGTVIFSAIGIMAMLIVLLPFMPQASADDTTCVFVLLPGAYDNVIVPAGTFCMIQSGVTINGNLEIESDAIVRAQFLGTKTVKGNVEVASGVIFHVHKLIVEGNLEAKNCKSLFFDSFDNAKGNVEIEGCKIISISNSIIGGDVQVKKSGNGFLNLENNDIGGNVQIEDNTNFRIIAASNTIDGNLEYKKNTLIGGPNFIESVIGSNIVGGNLECFDNTPSPMIAPFGLNTVTGDKEGECALL